MNMNYNDEENLDVVNDTNTTETQHSTTDFKASKKTTEKVTKNIQKRMSQASIKNAGKQTLLKALLPVITYVAVFIIILIIIIGIAMFFITMPGMVVEQVKDFANDVGSLVAKWFGQDVTTDVSEVEIYDTLDYLEQMGYDLKGNGFLTEYVGDTADGVERDGDGLITNAESEFITNYLVSDKYVYTIKNFNSKGNMGILNPIIALGRHILSLLTEGQSNEFWSRGMIEIFHDDGTIGKESRLYSVFEPGFVKIDANKKTLEIKRGWFNNSLTYNLDGWTGRYGMPIDFLLSVHISTMMPDLAYDMANGFETVIKLLLHPVDSSETTAVGYYKINENSYKSYDDFHDIADSWVPLDAWQISKKEAAKIMKEFKIKSPDNCTGIADNEPEDVIPNVKKEANLNEDYQAKIEKYYQEMITDLKELGYSGNLADTITYDEFYAKLQQCDVPYNDAEGTGLYGGGSSPIYKSYAISESWLGTYDDAECQYTANITYAYHNYSYNGKKETVTCVEISYEVERDLTEEEKNEILEKYNAQNIKQLKCSERIANGEELNKVCKECRDHIRRIYSYVKKADVSDLEIYQPYISKVEKHWYRDVYFVYDTRGIFNDKNVNLVDSDYDYESVMKERWTLYETYTEEDNEPELIGEYKLYEIDENGNYKGLFKGTEEDAANKNIKVAKKAVTIDIQEQYEDLNWNVKNGVYSAYKESDTVSHDFQPAYPNIEENDPDADIKPDIYVDVQSTGYIVQTGEGMRAETNSKIKKMFLENTYFRYDGTAPRAEIITELRNKNNLGYGALSDADLNKTVQIDDKTYKVEEYAGQVSLNQDSLNAFSMLENEHTLDADYIYRDFKELIVELGYFEKQELTDETPRIIQWLIPTIGSYEYPARELDKNEHEYGTMIHSEGDLDANKKNTLVEAIEAAAKEDENIDNAQKTEEQNKDVEIDSNTDSNTEVATVEPSTNITQNVGNIEISENNTKFDLVGANSPTNTSGSLLSLDEWWEETQKMFDIYKADGWVYSDHGKGASQGCNANTTFETHGHEDTDCSIGASWMLQKLGALKDNHTFTSHMGSSGLNESHVCAQDLLDAGAEVITPEDGTKFTQAATSGKLEPGDLLFYDGHVSIYCGESYEDAGATYCWDTGSTDGIQKGGPRDTGYEDRDIELIVRLPLGNSSKGDSYQGYQGNEAVVSPVTGILLEYGTYTDEDAEKGYRTNVDLKYGTGLIGNNSEENLPENNNPNQEQGKIQVDKVGYAKILVLDEENYALLEQELINSTRWKDEGKIKEINNLTEDDVNGEDNPWTDLEKTLYNSWLYNDLYKEYGISGNVIYIDGFKCELPQEEFDVKQNEKTIPDGKDIDMNYFEKITTGSFSNGNITDEDTILDSLYEKEEDYKLASQRATNKRIAESIVKNEAISSLYISGENEIRLIKEGTVIGRTMTDYELLEQRGQSEEYDQYRKTQNSPDGMEEKVIGNYLRIQMRDKDKTLVENVEDYMKLDEEGGKANVSQEYQAWEGDLEILAEGIYLEASYGCLSGGELFRNNQEEADFEMYCMGYSIVNKLLEQNKQWYGHLYDETRTDRSPLAQVLTSDWYGVKEEMEAFINGGPSHYTEKELEYAEYCLTYDCTSITKPNESKLGSYAIQHGYTTTEPGTVIPRAMCQQGGLADGAPGQDDIILVGYWDHNDNYEFDEGDELWGVDRVMEHLIED